MNEVALAIGGVVLACLLSYVTARVAGRASKEAAQITVDAQAYTRAKEMYESALSTGRREIEGLKQDVTDLQAKVEGQTGEIQQLRSQVVRYEGRVDQLEGTLRRHRIPVPAWASQSNLAVVRDDVVDDPNKPEPLEE